MVLVVCQYLTEIMLLAFAVWWTIFWYFVFLFGWYIMIVISFPCQEMIFLSVVI